MDGGREDTAALKLQSKAAAAALDSQLFSTSLSASRKGCVGFAETT